MTQIFFFFFPQVLLDMLFCRLTIGHCPLLLSAARPSLNPTTGYCEHWWRGHCPPMSSFYQLKYHSAVICVYCGQLHEQNGTHLYDYYQPVDEDMTCHICLQPLVNPIDTKCGHTFCSRCLKNYLKVQHMCPVDRQPLTLKDCQQSSVLVRR